MAEEVAVGDDGRVFGVFTCLMATTLTARTHYSTVFPSNNFRSAWPLKQY